VANNPPFNPARKGEISGWINQLVKQQPSIPLIVLGLHCVGIDVDASVDEVVGSVESVDPAYPNEVGLHSGR
jgi:hypothetical protein